MSISIGDALLKVGVDKKDFDRDMKGIGASLKKHQKAIGIGMVAMGAAIVGVATKSVLNFAKMGDEIAKMAKRTGFSTEALSELRHAAELSGASLQSLEKASRTLSGAILDANYGLLSYQRGFDKLGLSYERLAKQTPEDQMMAVLEALANLTNESERAAIAADLFGRAGTQLLPMLSDGAAGLAEMRQEAHELGIVFDMEAAVAAEEMTDAMTRLKSGVKGAEIAIAKALVPVLTPLLDKVTKLAKAMGEWIGENKTLAQIVAAGGALMIGLGGLLLILPKLKLAVIALKGALTALALNPIVMLIAGLGMLGFGIYSLIQHHEKWNDVVDASTKYNEELEKAQGKLTEGVIESARAYVELREEVGNILPEEEKQMASLNNLITLYDEGELVLNDATGALELHRKEVEKLTKATDKAIDKQKELFGLLASAVEAKEPLIAIEMAAAKLAGKWGALRALEAAHKGISVEELLKVRPKHLFPQYYPPELQHGGIITKPTLAFLGEQAPRVKEFVFNERQLSMMGGGYKIANIYMIMDGRTVAKAIGEPLVDEIRIRTGAKL